MEMGNIDDLRNAARRRLPKIFFDYIDGGGDNRSDRTFGGRVGVMQRAELRIIGENQGLPTLDDLEIGIVRNPLSDGAAVDHLYDTLRRDLSHMGLDYLGS